MQSITNTKIRLVVGLVAALAMLAVSSAALAGRGGNDANAKLCQKGGWSSLMDSAARPFVSEDACVSYAAQGGSIYPAAKLVVKACDTQPYDGICVTTTGSGLEVGSIATTTLSKNGQPTTEDFSVVQAGGTVSSSPLQHFELPCVAGNEYSASATGISADSASYPTLPGIPVTSNTVERTSACP
jgi:hypothetical protein